MLVLQQHGALSRMLIQCIGLGFSEREIADISCIPVYPECSCSPPRRKHIKLCLLLWFDFFRTIALLLGALGDFIVGYSKSSSASVECRREIFGRANFHPRVVSLGINVSSKVGDDVRSTGEGTEQCRRAERTAPPLQSRPFHVQFFRLHWRVEFGNFAARQFSEKKRIKSARRFLKFAFWDTVSSKKQQRRARSQLVLSTRICTTTTATDLSYWIFFTPSLIGAFESYLVTVRCRRVQLNKERTSCANNHLLLWSIH